jgi:GntR family transcriptional repressor for pyruvate dehydrogenase complex
MRTYNFEPISYKKLSEVIEQHIMDLILKGEIEPGDRLPSEGEIGNQFGVSLVTVREALKGLETYGLIEKKKGRGGGIFASRPSSDAVKISLFHFLNQKHFSSADLSELRMIMEPAASRIAAARMWDDKLAELRANIDQCEALVRAAEADFSEHDFFELEKGNIAFHRLIGEATGNPVLILTIEYVLDFLFNFKRVMLAPNLEFSQAVVRDHGLIFSTLKERDGEAAERAMIVHVRYVEAYLTAKEGNKSAGPTAKRAGWTIGRRP